MFEPLKLGAYHMIGNDDWEPQRTNNYELRFPTLPQLYTAQTGVALPSNASDVLTLSNASCSGINSSIDALKVSYGNNSINFAGKPSYNDISADFNDFIGIKSLHIIEAWRNLVYDPYTEKIGRASQYKMPGYMIEYAPDGVTSKMWQIEGCFPGPINYGSFSNDDNSIRKISVTFYIDVAKLLD